MIREREVRLIDTEGNHAGIVTIDEALRRAQQAGLDLVEVGAKAKPHVCRIMDYGQYKYEQSKKVKEAKKKQRVIVVKEIKLRPRIDDHDYAFKLNHAQKFLEHGDKVRFILQFRGREMAHKDLGRVVMDRIIKDLENLALIEQAPKIEGRFMNMTLAPQPGKKVKKAGEAGESGVDTVEDIMSLPTASELDGEDVEDIEEVEVVEADDSDDYDSFDDEDQDTKEEDNGNQA